MVGGRTVKKSKVAGETEINRRKPRERRRRGRLTEKWDGGISDLKLEISEWEGHEQDLRLCFKRSAVQELGGVGGQIEVESLFL